MKDGSLASDPLAGAKLGPYARLTAPETPDSNRADPWRHGLGVARSVEEGGPRDRSPSASTGGSVKIVRLDVSLTPMTDRTIPAQYRGWWRIVDTGIVPGGQPGLR